MTRRQRMTEAQRRYEKTDKGRAARRKQNVKRIAVLGDRLTISDPEVRDLARRLRDERREAIRGRQKV